MMAIFSLTWRQVLGRKSTLLLLLFCALPVLLALVFRFGDSTAEPERWTVRVLLSGLVVRLILPVVAVFLGTSVFGNEVEDGTAVYLLTKPTPRWQILGAKIAVAWVVTVILILPLALVAAEIARHGAGDGSIALGFGIALVAGALAYAAVFLLISLVTSRALIAGLAYVFVWEAVFSGIFTGTRVLSVRHLTLGIADAIAHTRPGAFDSDMNPIVSMVGMALVVACIAWLALRRLEAFELREPA